MSIQFAKPVATTPQRVATVKPDASEPVATAERPKTRIGIRLDDDVIAAFKAGGPGWQTRINDALRKAIS